MDRLTEEKNCKMYNTFKETNSNGKQQRTFERRVYIFIKFFFVS